MKTATARELRNAFPAVMRHVRSGETVEITLRGRVVATLSPPPAAQPAKQPWANLDVWMSELRKDPKSPVTGAALLREARDRY